MANLKLTMGIKPSLPRYQFIGPFATTKQAESNIPFGLEYKGQVVGMDEQNAETRKRLI